MPQVGDVKKGTDIGYKSINKWIWIACIDWENNRRLF